MKNKKEAFEPTVMQNDILFQIFRDTLNNQMSAIVESDYYDEMVSLRGQDFIDYDVDNSWLTDKGSAYCRQEFMKSSELGFTDEDRAVMETWERMNRVNRAVEGLVAPHVSVHQAYLIRSLEYFRQRADLHLAISEVGGIANLLNLKPKKQGLKIPCNNPNCVNCKNKSYNETPLEDV